MICMSFATEVEFIVKYSKLQKVICRKTHTKYKQAVCFLGFPFVYHVLKYGFLQHFEN
jgi:hypothetical protein